MNVSNSRYKLKQNYRFYFINNVHVCRTVYVRALMCVHTSVSYFFITFCFFIIPLCFVPIYSSYITSNLQSFFFLNRLSHFLFCIFSLFLLLSLFFSRLIFILPLMLLFHFTLSLFFLSLSVSCVTSSGHLIAG
jgi:hypothetical protein